MAKELVVGLRDAWRERCAAGDEEGMDKARRALDAALRVQAARRASSSHMRVAKRIADSILAKVAS